MVNHIALSIEELIYCFYTEGCFEQGNGLKQVYLNGITDEQLDLALQIVCRTLLSKNLIRYAGHKFVLHPDVSDIISSLHYSDRTIRVSKHDSGSEEAVSFHVTGEKVLQHSLDHGGQVHVFKKVGIPEISQTISSLFGIKKGEADPAGSIRLTQASFEELLSCIDGNESDWNAYLRNCPIELHGFSLDLKEAGGLLNTVLILEFNNSREPSVQNVALFPNHTRGEWMILKDNDDFVITECDEESVSRFVLTQLSEEGARIGT